MDAEMNAEARHKCGSGYDMPALLATCGEYQRGAQAADHAQFGNAVDLLAQWPRPGKTGRGDGRIDDHIDLALEFERVDRARRKVQHDAPDVRVGLHDGQSFDLSQFCFHPGADFRIPKRLVTHPNATRQGGNHSGHSATTRVRISLG